MAGLVLKEVPLSPAMQKVFGTFGGHVSIQRSPPRWVQAKLVDKAIEFLKKLAGYT